MSKVATQQRDQARARKYWASLDNASRWALGDALVLGDLDHLDWFGRRESRAFLNALDYERTLWEQGGAC